jgi:hypothetical protein
MIDISFQGDDIMLLEREISEWDDITCLQRNVMVKKNDTFTNKYFVCVRI